MVDPTICHSRSGGSQLPDPLGTGLSDSSEELWAVPISGHLEAMRDLGLDAGAGERKLFLGSCGGFHYCTIYIYII